MPREDGHEKSPIMAVYQASQAMQPAWYFVARLLSKQMDYSMSCPFLRATMWCSRCNRIFTQ